MIQLGGCCIAAHPACTDPTAPLVKQWKEPSLDRVHASRHAYHQLPALRLSRAAVECSVMPQVLLPEAAAAYGRMSLGAYLARHGYSEAFRRNYLLPMCAAVWSVPNAQVGQPLRSGMHCTCSHS